MFLLQFYGNRRLAPCLPCLITRFEDGDTEPIQVAVGLHLGTSRANRTLWKTVGCRAIHGFIGCKSEGHHPRHAALNDVIPRALTLANVPSHLCINPQANTAHMDSTLMGCP